MSDYEKETVKLFNVAWRQFCQKRYSLIDRLRQLANEVDAVQRGAKIATTTGYSLAIAGALLLLVGRFVFRPLTVIAATAVTVGISSVGGAAVVNFAKSSKQVEEAKTVLDKDAELRERLVGAAQYAQNRLQKKTTGLSLLLPITKPLRAGILIDDVSLFSLAADMQSGPKMATLAKNLRIFADSAEDDLLKLRKDVKVFKKLLTEIISE